MLNAGCLSFAAATWEGSRPEEADGLTRKDVAWNEEQCGAEGQWNFGCIGFGVPVWQGEE